MKSTAHIIETKTSKTNNFASSFRRGAQHSQCFSQVRSVTDRKTSRYPHPVALLFAGFHITVKLLVHLTFIVVSFCLTIGYTDCKNIFGLSSHEPVFRPLLHTKKNPQHLFKLIYLECLNIYTVECTQNKCRYRSVPFVRWRKEMTWWLDPRHWCHLWDK